MRLLNQRYRQDDEARYRLVVQESKMYPGSTLHTHGNGRPRDAKVKHRSLGQAVYWCLY